MFDCAMGERAIKPMGHVRMMAAVPAVPVRRDLQDREHAGDGDGRGRSRTSTPGLEARPEGAGDLPRQLQGRPAAVGRRRKDQRRPTAEAEPPSGSSSTGRSRKRLPKSRPAETTSFTVGGAEGYMTAGVVPGRRPRRGLPQDGQAGLDAGRDDGRVLDRDLDRPAVRRAAGDVRREVHQHAVRAGRADRRPGRPDEREHHGLHLPPAGAGLPAVRDPRGDSASTPPRSAPASSRRARTWRRSPTTSDVEEELEALAQSAPSVRPKRRRAPGRPSWGRRRSSSPVTSRAAPGWPRPSRHRSRCTPRPS